MKINDKTVCIANINTNKFAITPCLIIITIHTQILLNRINFSFCFIFSGDAAYFTMTDVKLTISIHNKLLPSDRPVITMFARDFGSKNGTFLRYSINETNGYLHVYPPRGDVLFTNDFHQGKGKNI